MTLAAVGLACGSPHPAPGAPQPATVEPKVEVEEVVYEHAPADNGAGPLWCYGATCVVRNGEDVFVSGLETLPGLKPLNNCRWTLFHRGASGWRRVQADPVGRQREPCPLGVFDDGRLFLSTNPTLTESNAYSGPANPHLLQFSARDPARPGAPLQPVWSRNPGFSEHSYRGLGADGRRHELLVLNNHGYEEQYWAFRDRAGQWHNRGVIRYPIRGCYPEVALADGIGHVLAIGDVVEPVAEWRQWKFEQSKRSWDYVFRRLFYARNPGLASNQFATPLEVANVDRTGGHIQNLDLWVDRAGVAHLLYRQTTVSSAAFRDRFLPDVAITTSLELRLVKAGRVTARRTLLEGGEGAGPETPGWARFHATPDGRLFVFHHVSGRDSQGTPLDENRLLEVLPDGRAGATVRVALRHPFTSFMTATERAGCAPARALDLLGACSGRPGTEIRYARIRL